MEIVIKSGTARRKGKGHKGIRSAHNKATGKYLRQAVNTRRNKARNITRNIAQGDSLAGVSQKF